MIKAPGFLKVLTPSVQICARFKTNQPQEIERLKLELALAQTYAVNSSLILVRVAAFQNYKDRTGSEQLPPPSDG